MQVETSTRQVEIRDFNKTIWRLELWPKNDNCVKYEHSSAMVISNGSGPIHASTHVHACVAANVGKATEVQATVLNPQELSIQSGRLTPVTALHDDMNSFRKSNQCCRLLRVEVVNPWGYQPLRLRVQIPNFNSGAARRGLHDSCYAAQMHAKI
jgi:hypothetical protein